MSGGGAGYPGGKRKPVTKEEIKQIILSESKRKCFEYKSVDAWHFVKENNLGHGGDDEVVLNMLGAEGWELVCKEGKWDYRVGATPVFLMKREIL